MKQKKKSSDKKRVEQGVGDGTFFLSGLFKSRQKGKRNA